MKNTVFTINAIDKKRANFNLNVWREFTTEVGCISCALDHVVCDKSAFNNAVHMYPKSGVGSDLERIPLCKKHLDLIKENPNDFFNQFGEFHRLHDGLTIAFSTWKQRTM